MGVTGHFKRVHPGLKFGSQNHLPLSIRALVTESFNPKLEDPVHTESRTIVMSNRTVTQ